MSDDFARKLDEVIDYYLSVGCPCRFPRFRAVVSRDTSRTGGGSFASADQQGLIRAYESKVPLTEKGPVAGWPISADMYAAKCGICGSSVTRSSNEGAPGGWVDYLVIHLRAGLMDLGARVEHGRAYRATPFRATGPGSAGMRQATEANPLLDEDAWFAWMRELKPTPS